MYLVAFTRATLVVLCRFENGTADTKQLQENLLIPYQREKSDVIYHDSTISGSQQS